MAGGQPPRLTFIYRNWRGEIGVRQVVEPISIWFGRTEWHPEAQWLLKAMDVEKGEMRDFAYSEIINVDHLFTRPL